MNPIVLWLATFVFGLAIAVGTIWFGFVILGIVPVIALVAASNTKRLGLSGLLLGFGGFYLVESTWTLFAALLAGIGLLLAGAVIVESQVTRGTDNRPGR